MPHTPDPPTDASMRAAAILRDHVEGLHEPMDDPDLGCRWPGCENAYWLLAHLHDGKGVVSIEELLA